MGTSFFHIYYECEQMNVVITHQLVVFKKIRGFLQNVFLMGWFLIGCSADFALFIEPWAVTETGLSGSINIYYKVFPWKKTAVSTLCLIKLFNLHCLLVDTCISFYISIYPCHTLSLSSSLSLSLFIFLSLTLSFSLSAVRQLKLVLIRGHLFLFLLTALTNILIFITAHT